MTREEIDDRLAAAISCLQKAREQLDDITLKDIRDHSLEGVHDVSTSIDSDGGMLSSLLDNPRFSYEVTLEAVEYEEEEDPENEDPENEDPENEEGREDEPASDSDPTN